VLSQLSYIPTGPESSMGSRPGRRDPGTRRGMRR
jgi:hypothetical protein